MSDSPWKNALVTFREAVGNTLTVPRLDSIGRILVNMSNTANAPAQATPPAGPTNGDLWFNTSATFNGELMVFDSTRNFWLSAGPGTPYRFGHDNTDNAALRSSDIHAPGTGSGHEIPLDAMITRISAQSRAGLATKAFDIVSDGSTGSTVIGTVTLAANVFVDNNASIQLAQGDDLWINSQAAGGASNDIAICLWVKWRVAP